MVGQRIVTAAAVVVADGMIHFGHGRLVVATTTTTTTNESVAGAATAAVGQWGPDGREKWALHVDTCERDRLLCFDCVRWESVRERERETENGRVLRPYTLKMCVSVCKCTKVRTGVTRSWARCTWTMHGCCTCVAAITSSSTKHQETNKKSSSLLISIPADNAITGARRVPLAGRNRRNRRRVGTRQTHNNNNNNTDDKQRFRSSMQSGVHCNVQRVQQPNPPPP